MDDGMAKSIGNSVGGSIGGSVGDRTKGVTFNPSAATATARALPRPAWKNAAILLACTALVALCAHIAIPLGFTPVPVTLQPFAVLLLGLLFGPRFSFAALVLYLIEGASGLPVFNPHGPGGIAQLFGPTGGYLLAAPFAAATAGRIYCAASRRLRSSIPGGIPPAIPAAILGALAGDALLLTLGALWLGILERTHLSLVLAQSVAPFLASDTVQLLAAAACALVLRSFTQPREPLLRA
jgi:biotin transport system substrate-specific component